MAVKPIEQVKQGEYVVARNEQTGKMEYKRVLQTTQRQVDVVLAVTLADARTGQAVETIAATREHPFYVQGKGFVPAGGLAIGNSIVTRAGPALVVKSIAWQRRAESYSVYNFVVDDHHTYFVGNTNGGAWVHNPDCFSAQEEAIADYLLSLDRTVSKNTQEGVTGAGRQGDAIVDGLKAEFKNLASGATDAYVKNAVGKSLEGGSQADHIIIWARGSGLTKELAQHGARRAIGTVQVNGKTLRRLEISVMAIILISFHEGSACPEV